MHLPGNETLSTRTMNCTSAVEGAPIDRDKQAVLYIVVVLLFYSAGITIAMVMYLKREKAEVVEEKAYEDYMNFRADPDKWAYYFRVQQMLYHLNKVERARDEREEAREYRRLRVQGKLLWEGDSSGDFLDVDMAPSALTLTRKSLSQSTGNFEGVSESKAPISAECRLSLPNITMEFSRPIETSASTDSSEYVSETKLAIDHV